MSVSGQSVSDREIAASNRQSEKMGERGKDLQRECERSNE